ncbi:alpha/beta fold hydrolase [Actinomyces sp.]|uniref:alpha/beta fold hydrolase n=1 Tax=Actinomyces sp. TaxID=29317 RepID=UPI0026DCCB34|nr:hypothetical protein [Actinomyces sp.]MDO4900682.1 hypothetical protein [Actinomyces sp.]
MRAINALGACPERFNRIATKTLLLRGSASAAWLRRTAAEMAQATPGTRLTDLSGHGHAINTTAPSNLAKVIRSFLQD